MKIIQFMASEGWGGAEKVLVELTNELAKYHETTVLILRETIYKNRFSHNVRIRELRSNPTRYNPFLAFELYSVLCEEKPDIVHTHAIKATELVAGINKLLPFKHIGTKHNTRKGKIFNSINFVTAVSPVVAHSIRKHPNSHLAVIPNGINPVSLSPVTKDKQKFGMLAIGRLDKIKGFDILIKEVQKISFDFQLLIVGQGPEKEPLQNLIIRTGMEKKIILAGYEENIPLLMKKSDLVIVSSHAEGFSKVILEALFYAPVLISTPVGIAPDLLPENMLIQHNELADKINEVYQNKDYFMDLFQKIKIKKSAHFLMKNIVDSYLRFYENIVK